MKIKYLILLFLISLFVVDRTTAQVKKTIVIKGKIINYDAATNPEKSIVFAVNEMAFDDDNSAITKINANGTFNIIIPSARTQSVHFEYQNQRFYFYAGPGAVVQISFEAADVNKSIHFGGTRAKLNNDLHLYDMESKDLYRALSSQWQKEAPLVENDPEKSKALGLDLMDRKLAYFRDFAQKHHVDSLFNTIESAAIKYSTGHDLAFYGLNRHIKADYYENIFARIPVKDKRMLISDVYIMYLHDVYMIETDHTVGDDKQQTERPAGLGISDKALNTMRQPPSGEEMAHLILAKRKDLEPNEINVLKKFSPNSPAEKPTTEDTAALSAILTANEEIIIENSPVPTIEYYLHKDADWLRDLFLTWSLHEMVDANYTAPVKQYISIYQNTVKDQYLKKKTIDFYNQRVNELTLAKLSQNTHITPALKTQADSVLNKLVAKFPGKVVYIDFWGTWCAPCIAEMPASKALNKSLSGKDVVFLYLGVNCAEQNWKQVIAKLGIGGEHYLLSNEETKYLETKFQIDGYPHYALLNKQGVIVNKNAARPSQPDLKKQIESLLKND